MKGKIAFLLGAGVGYVLGTRAGRERYEQIKRGARAVWQTEPVQRGVEVVKGAVDDRADDVKAFARRVGADLFSTLARGTGNGTPSQRPRSSAGAKASDAGAESHVSTSAAQSTPQTPEEQA